MKLNFMKDCQKKMKRFHAFTNIVDIGLITSTVITGRVSSTTCSNVNDLSFGNALSGTTLLFPLGAAIPKKCFKIFNIKQKNTMQLSCLLRAK